LAEGTEPLSVSASEGFTRSGLAHDVSFPDAGVSPQTPGLPSRAQVLVAQGGRLRDELVRGLNRRYATLYCSAAGYSLDQAARCAFSDPKTAPGGVRSSFETAVGGDVERFLTLLAR